MSHSHKWNIFEHKNSFIGRLRSGSLPGWTGDVPRNESEKEENGQNQSASTPDIGINQYIFSQKSENDEKKESKDQLEAKLSKNIGTIVEEDYDIPSTPKSFSPTLHQHRQNFLAEAEKNGKNPFYEFKSYQIPSGLIKTTEKINEEKKINLRSQQKLGNEALGVILSALYGKIIVIMGIAFPMSEVISSYIPQSFYDGFYLYLYFGSITFMICIFGNIQRQKAGNRTLTRINTLRTRSNSTGGCETEEELFPASLNSTRENTPEPHSKNEIRGVKSFRQQQQREHHSFGSFYVRMGAVVFGIGSMIYSGLEFRQFFELSSDPKCYNIMLALTPAVRMIFTFGQMYFIFLNSKMAPSSFRYGTWALFGFMHMIGTNLCVWLNVLVQETMHEIHNFHMLDYVSPDSAYANNYNPNSNSYNNYNATIKTSDSSHLRLKRALGSPSSVFNCRSTTIMGSLVDKASPFLFPCTIESSLICAAIVYVMWESVVEHNREEILEGRSAVETHGESKKQPHNYSVNCAKANRGLFLGIFVLIMTIISLILFFVMVAEPEYQEIVAMEITITELALYVATTLAVIIGMYQVRKLQYYDSRKIELDNLLLIIAQTGSIIYNVFTIIACRFTSSDSNRLLVLITAVASLAQLLLQTIFILDVSKRCASGPGEVREKPGRQVVTFLLVSNFGMWLINTFVKSRAENQRVQLEFYGVWAWTIIARISMPLAIFHRFHSTACLCEIWMKSFKLKSTKRH